jgi:hypothetical protein
MEDDVTKCERFEFADQCVKDMRKCFIPKAISLSNLKRFQSRSVKALARCVVTDVIRRVPQKQTKEADIGHSRSLKRSFERLEHESTKRHCGFSEVDTRDTSPLSYSLVQWHEGPYADLDDSFSASSAPTVFENSSDSDSQSSSSSKVCLQTPTMDYVSPVPSYASSEYSPLKYTMKDYERENRSPPPTQKDERDWDTTRLEQLLKEQDTIMNMDMSPREQEFWNLCCDVMQADLSSSEDDLVIDA